MTKPGAPGYGIDMGSGDPLEIGGWDALNNFEKLAEEATNEQLEHQLNVASMYRQLFSTQVGRYVLHDLVEEFFKQDIFQETDEPGSHAPPRRQGRADVVKRIFFMIEFANTGGGKMTGAGVLNSEE